MSTEDKINPSYYKGNIECIEAIQEATKDLKGFEAFLTGTAIKYLWRWKAKNGVEDLEKSIWYIERLIELKSPIDITCINLPNPTMLTNPQNGNLYPSYTHLTKPLDK